MGEVNFGDFWGNTPMLQVTVADQGIGMSEEEQQRVFEPFTKTINIESQKLNRHGNGVGLSICKQICESLDGDISVKSKEGVGSTFTFVMKVYKSNNDTRNQLRSSEEKTSEITHLPPIDFGRVSQKDMQTTPVAQYADQL